jgi:propanol-preferring alcohol dehydrogenase
VPGCGLDTCSECSRDLSQLCQRGTRHGIGQDGFFAEFVAVNARAAVSVPEGNTSYFFLKINMLIKGAGILPAVAAVATDAVNTAYHGITRRAEVKKEETVFLFGLGGLGFNALQIVRYIGARVIVSDMRQEKLDAARALGLPRTDIVPLGKSMQDFVKENDLQEKIDTILEFVGKHQTFQDAQDIGIDYIPMRFYEQYLDR